MIHFPRWHFYFRHSLTPQTKKKRNRAQQSNQIESNEEKFVTHSEVHRQQETNVVELENRIRKH